ncbi:MAG: hypothetical protein ABH872_02060 [Candidatus Omnitrophota bacterium]
MPVDRLGVITLIANKKEGCLKPSKNRSGEEGNSMRLTLLQAEGEAKGFSRINPEERSDEGPSLCTAKKHGEEGN